MRIVGEIQHPVFKITIFKMDNRFSVKLEDGLFEQTYKFREGPLVQSTEDIRRLVNKDFIDKALRILEQMQAVSAKALDEKKLKELSEFDEII